MPKKTPFSELSPEEKRVEIFASAKKAVKRGTNCPSVDRLKGRRNFSDDDATLYREAYQLALQSTPDFLLRKARYDAQSIAVRGGACPTNQELEKCYNAEQIAEYLAAFEKSRKSPEEQLNRLARRAGKQAASQGVLLLSEEDLILNRNFSLAQARAYIDGYQESSGGLQEQILLRAKKSGRNAANQNTRLLSIEELILTRGYTQKEAEVYTNAYNSSIRTPQKQILRKARVRGQHAAFYGYRQPNKETLLSRNKYTEEEAEAYIQAYNESKGSAELQKMRKAKRLGRAKATKNIPLLSKPQLMIKWNYSEQEANTYIESYHQSVQRRKPTVREKIAKYLEMFAELFKENDQTIETPNDSLDGGSLCTANPALYLESLRKTQEENTNPFLVQTSVTDNCQGNDAAHIQGFNILVLESYLLSDNVHADSYPCENTLPQTISYLWPMQINQHEFFLLSHSKNAEDSDPCFTNTHCFSSVETQREYKCRV